MAVAKKKRVSKKNKVAWRKHVNIDDVEEFLEEKRLEERLGAPLSTLTDDQLYKIDTGAEPKQEIISKRERKRLKLLDPKSFSALKPASKISDPIKKRNRVRTKEERKSELVKRRELDRQQKGILKAKEIQSLKDYKVYESKKLKKHDSTKFDKDIWNEEANNEITSDLWAREDTKKHNLAGTGKLRKKVIKSVSAKTSVLPSVEAPHPGISYNPSFADHQDLLQAIVAKENKIIKEEEHLTRVTKGMFSKVTEEQRDTAWLEEMSQGLAGQNENHEENEDSDGDYKAVNPPVQNKKKTLKQRRKQQEQLKLQQERKAIKLEKKKVTDIYRLQILDNVIKKKQTKCDKLRQIREKKKELKKKEPKRLGALKFEEPDLDFNMGQDIAGNLRNMKKEGSLLLDRFRSMQKRNILPTTKRHVHKQAKVKVYTKPGHKENEWKKTVAKQF